MKRIGLGKEEGKKETKSVLEHGAYHFIYKIGMRIREMRPGVRYQIATTMCVVCSAVPGIVEISGTSSGWVCANGTGCKPQPLTSQQGGHKLNE